MDYFANTFQFLRGGGVFLELVFSQGTRKIGFKFATGREVGEADPF